MAPWSKGELGLMWLGVGIAAIVVAPIGLDGLWTALAVVIGAVAVVYGGTLAWQGMRKGPDDADAAGSGDEDQTS